MTVWDHGMALHVTSHQDGTVSAVTAPPSHKSIPASQHPAQTLQIKKPSTVLSHNFAPTPARQSPTHNKLHSPLHLVAHCGPQRLVVGDLEETGIVRRGLRGLVKCPPLSAAHHQDGDQEATGVAAGEDGVDPVVTDPAVALEVLGEDHGERRPAALLALVLLRGLLGLPDGDHSLPGPVSGLVAQAQLPHHRLLPSPLLLPLMAMLRSSLVPLSVFRLYQQLPAPLPPPALLMPVALPA